MQSVSSSQSQLCLVCGENADSMHFGALSCRACAAFFRRKVAGNQKTVKRCSGECKLENQVLRRLCASCRFEKCLKVGMRPSAVLSRLPIKSEDVPPDPTTSKPTKSLLEQLKEAYAELESARGAAFRRDKDHVPKLANCKQMNEVCFVDLKLIMEHFVPLFGRAAEMSEEHQKFLVAHFLVPFVLFDTSFRSVCSHPEGNYLVLPSLDYVDTDDLKTYYQNPEDVDNHKAKVAAMILEPYWKLNKQTLREHLREVQIDLAEFLLLTALIFWDFGLQDQSEECIEICKEMRSKVFEELTAYEKSIRTNDDHCMRVGEIVIVLQAVQKSLNIMSESREISMVYNLYEWHCPLFEIMKT